MRSVQGSAVLCRRCGECAPLHNGNNSFSFAHQRDEMRIRESEKKKEKRVIDQRLKRGRWKSRRVSGLMLLLLQWKELKLMCVWWWQAAWRTTHGLLIQFAESISISISGSTNSCQSWSVQRVQWAPTAKGTEGGGNTAIRHQPCHHPPNTFVTYATLGELSEECQCQQCCCCCRRQSDSFSSLSLCTSTSTAGDW